MSMKSNKSNLILEIIWLITGVLCIAAGIRMFITGGYNNRLLIVLLMAFVSFLFARFRHIQRKKS